MNRKFWLIPFLFGSSSSAWACTVCFGNPKSTQTRALLGGILFLLAMIATVLGGLVVTILRMRRRSQMPTLPKQADPIL